MSLLNIFLQAGGQDLIIPDLTYPNSPGYYLTDERGNPFGLGNYQYYSQLLNIKDKTVILWSQRDGDPWNDETMILVYDHFTNKLSNSFGIGEINPPNSDIHLMGTLFVNPTGDIFTVEENPHNSIFYIKKAIGFDIQNFSTISTTGIQAAYAHIHKIGSRYFNFYRQNNTQNRISFSDNDMVTWVDNKVTNSENVDWFYPMTPDSNDGIMHMFINRRVGGLGSLSFPILYYLKTSDGLNVSNLGGTFSKNITGDNNITDAELEANYKVDQLGDGSDNGEVIRAPGGVVVGGEVYTVGGKLSGGWQFIYSNNGSWVKKDIDFGAHYIYDPLNGDEVQNNSVLLRYISVNTFDLYIFGRVATYSQMLRFRTIDLGDNWTYKEQLTSGNFHHRQLQFTGNHTDLGYTVVACIRVTDSNYSDLFIQKI